MEESGGKEKTETNAGVHGTLGLLEIVRESREMEDRGKVDSPVRLAREARAVESVVLGRVILGGGRILFRDWLVVDVWSVRRQRSRTVRIRARLSHDSLSINVLELLCMVWTAYVMIVIRNDLPRRREEEVLMRGYNSLPV